MWLAFNYELLHVSNWIDALAFRKFKINVILTLGEERALWVEMRWKWG